jgi:hypothetical protein
MFSSKLKTLKPSIPWEANCPTKSLRKKLGSYDGWLLGLMMSKNTGIYGLCPYNRLEFQVYVLEIIF